MRELDRRDPTEVGHLRAALGLDWLPSRTLARLEERGILGRSPSTTDGRRQVAALTRRGCEASALLDRRADEAAAGVLGELAVTDREWLVAAMGTVRDLLAEAPPPWMVACAPPDWATGLDRGVSRRAVRG